MTRDMNGGVVNRSGIVWSGRMMIEKERTGVDSRCDSTTTMTQSLDAVDLHAVPLHHPTRIKRIQQVTRLSSRWAYTQRSFFSRSQVTSPDRCSLAHCQHRLKRYVLAEAQPTSCFSSAFCFSPAGSSQRVKSVAIASARRTLPQWPSAKMLRVSRYDFRLASAPECLDQTM